MKLRAGSPRVPREPERRFDEARPPGQKKRWKAASRARPPRPGGRTSLGEHAAELRKGGWGHAPGSSSDPCPPASWRTCRAFRRFRRIGAPRGRPSPQPAASHWGCGTSSSLRREGGSRGSPLETGAGTRRGCGVHAPTPTVRKWEAPLHSFPENGPGPFPTVTRRAPESDRRDFVQAVRVGGQQRLEVSQLHRARVAAALP